METHHIVWIVVAVVIVASSFYAVFTDELEKETSSKKKVMIAVGNSFAAAWGLVIWIVLILAVGALFWYTAGGNLG